MNLTAVTPSPSSNTVSRHYAVVDKRQVHYRRAGNGPLMVLIHQSPNNSKELLPLIHYLAANFTVIAPDTPGYGQSCPLVLSKRPSTIDDFVDALADFFDVLGLVKPMVYGSHSGAIIGVRLAARFPDKLAGLIANGVLINTAAERKSLCDNYFVPFIPQWDGSHLSWLWSRLKDQHSFYPWYDRSPNKVIHWPASDEDIHNSAMCIMEAGDNYRSAYRAVLDYAISEDLTRLNIPSLLLVAQTDALVRYVTDYPPLPKLAATQIVPDFSDLPAAILAFSRQHCVALKCDIKQGLSFKSQGLSKQFVATQQGHFHILSNNPASFSTESSPLLLLHELGASCETLSPLMLPIIDQRWLIAPDLPGHGESETTEALSPQAMADTLMSLLDALGLDKIDVLSVGNASACAFVLKTSYATRIGKVTFCNPALCNPEFSEAQVETPQHALLPDLTTDFAGSHLMRAWYYLRDRSLFHPWFERSSRSVINNAMVPDADCLQLSLLSLFKAKSNISEHILSSYTLSSEDLNSCPNALIASTHSANCNRFLSNFILLQEDLHEWPTTLWPEQQDNHG